MVEDEVLDIFNRFLDEATKNDTFAVNLTETDLLLKESANDIPAVKVPIALPSHIFVGITSILLQYLVEGILMFWIVCIGIIFNIVSVVFFVRQRSQRTFHR
jgi:hypothetical protein